MPALPDEVAISLVDDGLWADEPHAIYFEVRRSMLPFLHSYTAGLILN